MISKTVMRPNCKNQITIQVVPGEKTIITCPSCGAEGKFTFPIEKTEIKTTNYSSTIQVKRDVADNILSTSKPLFFR